MGGAKGQGTECCDGRGQKKVNCGEVGGSQLTGDRCWLVIGKIGDGTSLPSGEGADRNQKYAHPRQHECQLGNGKLNTVSGKLDHLAAP